MGAMRRTTVSTEPCALACDAECGGVCFAL